MLCEYRIQIRIYLIPQAQFLSWWKDERTSILIWFSQGLPGTLWPCYILSGFTNFPLEYLFTKPTHLDDANIWYQHKQWLGPFVPWLVWPLNPWVSEPGKHFPMSPKKANTSLWVPVSLFSEGSVLQYTCNFIIWSLWWVGFSQFIRCL